MKEINKFKKQLSGEYLQAFENAQLYYDLSNTDELIMGSV
jgi:hypothetical protein